MKNWIGLIILIILAVVAYFLINEDSDVFTIKEDFKDFAIEDTAAVDKIYMSQPNGNEITLSRRKNGKWLVNDGFPARPDAIQLILKTLHDIKVAGPVSQSTFTSVVKRLASNSKKVEFYVNGETKPLKTWYVGYVTASQQGTYMLLEKDGVKSAKPFITHLIMERGYLGSRFFLDPVLWRDRIVMKTDPKKIKSLEVIHASDTATSFRIDQHELSKFTITNLESNQTFPLSSLQAIPYFKKFESVYYEYLDVKSDAAELDSVYTSSPRHKITITTGDNKVIRLSTFNMPVAPGSMLEGKPIDYHPERMYAKSSEMPDEDFPVVQNLTFDPLVPKFKDFNLSTTVEK
jgi:hypothetical protein